VKIALVTTWFERGAAYVSRQYRDVLCDEHEVLIYARGGELSARGDPRWDGDNVTWARSIPTHGNTAFHLGHFRRWLLERRPDLVLFNEQQWWPPVLLCHDLGIRTAAYVDYYTESTLPLFGNYDLLLCHTRRHHSAFDWHPKNVYLPWGTRTDRFLPASDGPVQEGCVTFFHNAGLNPHRKGTDFVLDAFAALDHEARLVIHTQRDLASGLPDQTRQIEELRSASRLELRVGDIAEPGLYHLGDVYVYPTRLEGIGLTVPEALSCGLPVVVPDSPPMNEFVGTDCGRLVAIRQLQPRYDGYYWPQALVDPVDLRRQMAWYCENAGRLTEFKRAARGHAEQALDWRRNSRELPGILDNVTRICDESRRRAREAALDFERRRVDPRLFFPLTTRLLLKAADYLQPLASRYSGRGRKHPAGGGGS